MESSAGPRRAVSDPVAARRDLAAIAASVKRTCELVVARTPEAEDTSGGLSPCNLGPKLRIVSKALLPSPPEPNPMGAGFGRSLVHSSTIAGQNMYYLRVHV